LVSHLLKESKMKKYLVAATMLVAVVGQANAWENRRHNPPPRHNHNVAPWVAGGLALGVLGAMVYSQRPRCWEEPMIDRFGRQVYDAYGRPLAQRVCE